MENLYDEWNILKKRVASANNTVFCNTREIWWCSIGMNIGTEMYGKNRLFERPVLIMKVYNNETSLAIPLTSKAKTGRYYADVCFELMKSCALLSQARTISSKRLSRKVCRISEENFIQVQEKYIESLKYETPLSRDFSEPEGLMQ